MDLLHIIVLALVQGLTEFLPISSSAHLILVPEFLGWKDQGLAFDVAVHVGTLTAVVFYFRHEIVHMAGDWFVNVTGGAATKDSRLAWGVMISFLPVAFVGLLFHDQIEEHLRSPMLIAWSTVVFGLLLWLADVQGKRDRDEYSLTLRDVIIIGVAQALALVPGMSRSGITITAALMLGLTRSSAARFSFLLSLPTIAAAGSYETLNLIQSETIVIWQDLAIGIALSAISAYLCIHYFLKLLERVGMLPFVVYRVLLGLGLLILFS